MQPEFLSLFLILACAKQQFFRMFSSCYIPLLPQIPCLHRQAGVTSHYQIKLITTRSAVKATSSTAAGHLRKMFVIG